MYNTRLCRRTRCCRRALVVCCMAPVKKPHSVARLQLLSDAVNLQHQSSTSTKPHTHSPHQHPSLRVKSHLQIVSLTAILQQIGRSHRHGWHTTPPGPTATLREPALVSGDLSRAPGIVIASSDLVSPASTADLTHAWAFVVRESKSAQRPLPTQHAQHTNGQQTDALKARAPARPVSKGQGALIK